MSLTLKELYYSTKNKYHLELLSEDVSLSRVIDWVYVSEDINSFGFLNGGELVITTGISSEGAHWLSDFIQNLIESDACGLIVNTGPYLKRDDITGEILTLCQIHEFPLLIMPWDVHIHTLTKDYCSRIFNENLPDTAVTESFLTLLQPGSDLKQPVLTLDGYGFSKNDTYCICLLSPAHANGISKESLGNCDSQNRLLLHAKRYLRSTLLKHHITVYNNMTAVFCAASDLTEIQSLMKGLLEDFELYYPQSCLHAGIGSVVTSLAELSLSYQHAQAALTMSNYSSTPLLSFEDMGFFKILLSVNDTALLESYRDKYLKRLSEYDAVHHSSCLETLYNYLLFNGSIQAVADVMHCHRNTVNYRVHSLRDLLDDSLDDMQVRFDYMTAFMIKDYLNIFHSE